MKKTFSYFKQNILKQIFKFITKLKNIYTLQNLKCFKNKLVNSLKKRLTKIIYIYINNWLRFVTLSLEQKNVY